ncbi:MAG: hypothetical protein U5P41_07080 [Gammaproteobacteria bacterium]|nr:hypothetical protein [Gammaproteobacteria bacterium]
MVLDEAEEFAPQKPQRDEARMLGAMETLVKRGRSRGVGVTLITQRTASLNKNVIDFDRHAHRQPPRSQGGRWLD